MVDTKIKVSNTFSGAEDVAKHISKAYRHYLTSEGDYVPNTIENGFILGSYREKEFVEKIIEQVNEKFPASKGHIECRDNR